MKSKTSPFSFEKASDSTGYLLWLVTTTWQRGLNKMLKEFRLTQAQYVFLASLAWLSKSKDEVTQVDIAKHSQMNVMMVSDLIQTLYSRDLIKRSQAKKDSRAKAITITKKGEELVKRVVPKVEKYDRDFFKKLGSNLNGFNKNLQKLIN